MFVHLRCHSHYSFLRAVPRPEELVAAAAEQARVRDAVGAGLEPALCEQPFDKAGGSQTRPYSATGAHPALPGSLRGGAVALTDTNGLYAAVPFYTAARAAGVKPIVGAVLDVAFPVFDFRFSVFEKRTTKTENRNATTQNQPLLLLAEDFAGYSNLCQLVTTRHLEERPVTLEELHAHRDGLIALYAPDSRGGGFETRPYNAGEAGSAPANEATALKDIFGEVLYLEAQRLWPGDGRQLRETLRLGGELGIPVVATNNVHFLRPEEHLYHRVLNAVRTGTLLSTVARPEITSAEAHFKSAAEMQRAFPDHPELLRATLDIAERCNLELTLGKTIFPEFPTPAGETPFSYLWKLCFEGARRRYRPLTPPVLARLTHELEVIEKLSLAPYFLLVWDIVEEAKRRGIPAVARGSAASSMVTYCLGISRVCPLRWELYFERFLNEQRGDIPDIDIDICGARRDELLDYVYQRWGQSHVAMIASFVTMHARLAVREVAKVFGISTAEVNHFTRRLPHRPVREILDAIRTLPECRSLPAAKEPWKTILEVALRLDDFPRHLGIHPCGTVIAAQPLTHLVPLEVATKGIVVTQYDMHAIESLGLIKMDLLGQRGLTTMSLALRNMSGTGHEIEFDAIPEGDPATCEMIAHGRTLGIFQIESPGMRGLLRALRAKTLDDICLALALIRPGAAEYGSKESFLRRLRGREPVRYPHACTEPILRETLGICVYQEQVMQLAQAAGALSLAESDLVRRASAKFADRRERERLHSKFLKAAERLGLDSAARDDTWHMVEKFAGFGFCKAHAATYADLSYRIAYLKAHYPAEFLAAMCSSGAGFYHVSAYVEEAKRWGIEVRLPSVNHSRCEYTTEVGQTSRSVPFGVHVRSGKKSVTCCAPIAGNAPAEASRSVKPLCADGTDLEVCPTSAMRIGLMQVKGLRAETMAAIVHEREERGAYRSLEDFLARVPVERDEIELLIKVGAFDEVGQPPRSVPDSSEEMPGGEPGARVFRRGAVDKLEQHPASEEAGYIVPETRRTDLEVCPTTRPALLWRLNLALAHRVAHPAHDAASAGTLFPEAEASPAGAAGGREAAAGEMAGPAQNFATVDYTREQRLRYEQEILEVCVSGHPLDRFPRNGEAWSTDILLAADALRNVRSAVRDSRATLQDQPGCHPELAACPERSRRTAGEGSAFQPLPRRRALLIGQRVTLLGWVITFRRVGTKNYRNMMFVTCEDQRGVYEVVLFPPAYERYGGLVFETRLLRVTGRVEPAGQINCEKLEPLRA